MRIIYLTLFAALFTSVYAISLEAQRKVNAEHVIIYSEAARFAGWPANCAAEIFPGDELVTGFIEGPFHLRDGHNLAKPYTVWLARSRDGGKTWSTTDPSDYVGDYGEQPRLKSLSNPLKFTDPGFMMRVVGEGYHGANDPRAHFFVSTNRGNTWEGPFPFAGMDPGEFGDSTGLNEFTPRTDYLVTGEKECIIFFSAREKDVFGSDRLFCIKTEDGGLSFQFLGWILKPFSEEDTARIRTVDLYSKEDRNPYATQCRAVMSSSVRLPDGTLLTAVRRKHIVRGGTDPHWLDLYASEDGGKTWSFRSMISDTGPSNGNPPALEITADGRLVVAYGDRRHGTVNIIYSQDQGKTWGDPEILMDGFWSEDMEYNDLGYPRLFRRSDNKMVAVFYYSTREHPHHLRASIWKP